MTTSTLKLYSQTVINTESNLNKIDSRIAQSYFKNNSLTNLNQNPKGIFLYFPNNSKLIKSYILLKIIMDIIDLIN